MSELDRPRLEGSVAVRGGRRLSFAEFGDPRGAAIVWMHGTPGARRQIPLEARAFAEENDLRIIGVDRPGIGWSTPHLYDDILDWTGDLVELCDVLDIDTLRVIGLSGGGPYALAAGAAMPERVHGVGVLGGVAPTKGPDAISSGLMTLAEYAAPVLSAARLPARVRAGPGHPAGPSVRGDRSWTATPRSSRAATRSCWRGRSSGRCSSTTCSTGPAPTSAPCSPTSSCSPGPGASRPPTSRCRCTGGTATPTTSSRTRHGVHMSERLPHARFTTIDGESHLGGLGVATEVLGALMELGPRSTARSSAT